jgi:ribonuclease HII
MTAKFDRSLLPLSPDLSYEKEIWRQGWKYIGGIDEAGRGAWAGPVAAAVLVLPDRPDLETLLSGVRDSKQMTPAQRAVWAVKIKEIAAGWGVGQASCTEIDSIGILAATRLAARRALAALPFIPFHLLIDFITLPEVPIPQTCLVKGDARVLSIAGASILAKTARDTCMEQLDVDYPGYGFARHKGYGTAVHLAALQQSGPTPIHRFTFAPVKAVTIRIT